jgi:hypothetical protein
MMRQKVNALPRDPVLLTNIGAIHYFSARFLSLRRREASTTVADRRGIARLADSVFTPIDRDH